MYPMANDNLLHSIELHSMEEPTRRIFKIMLSRNRVNLLLCKLSWIFYLEEAEAN